MIKQRNMTSIFLYSDNKILLLYRQGSRIVNNVWIGAAGGHFEESELNNAEACVLRELQEELSISSDMLKKLKLRYITMRQANGEIRINYFFFAELPDGDKMELQSNEGILKWFEQEEIMKLDMSFAAHYVMEHYLAVGQFDELIYGGIADGEKMVFTEMPEF